MQSASKHQAPHKAWTDHFIHAEKVFSSQHQSPSSVWPSHHFSELMHCMHYDHSWDHHCNILQFKQCRWFQQLRSTIYVMYIKPLHKLLGFVGLQLHHLFAVTQGSRIKILGWKTMCFWRITVLIFCTLMWNFHFGTLDNRIDHHFAWLGKGNR